MRGHAATCESLHQMGVIGEELSGRMDARRAVAKEWRQEGIQ